jgi:glycosyltransferase involved in cell wall biosynthesis
MGHSTIPISVVIPTYNRSRLLRRAIACVLDQTVSCKEILVVDDGSTDDTVDVVRSFGPPVRLILQQHGGPSRARNLGVAESTTDWIAFLDSDDLWHPDYLERMSGAIGSTSGTAAVYFSDVTYDTTTQTHWQKSGFVSPEPIHLIPEASRVAMMETHPMLLPFTVFRKDVYQRYGGLLETLWSAEDTHLFIRLGLGETLCAVKHIGGIVTSDESDPRNRLTMEYDSGTVR